MFRSGWVAVLLGLGASALGCGGNGPNGGAAESENVGRATFDLTAVPTGIGCVRITVTGSSTVTKDFALAAGASSATLNMDRQPLGSITIDGSAYATTCGTGVTLYIADASTATISAGVVSALSLTFRKDNPVNASVNFVGNVQAISAQYYATYAVIDGVVYKWGRDPVTGLGNPTPTAVTTGTSFVDLNQGFYSQTPCAIKSDGTLWCWGYNGYGEAGVATPAVVTTLTQVGTDASYAMAASGYLHMCGGEPSGKLLKCWGYNGSGQLGASGTGGPTPVNALVVSPKAVTAGVYHTCAISAALDVLCWGYNGSGQLGDGTINNRSFAGVVTAPPPSGLNGGAYTPLSPASGVAAGGYFTCALSGDGNGFVQCWGDNQSGQLGDNTFANHSLPAGVWNISHVSKISAGYGHMCAIMTDGSVRCWGNNAFGEVGDGTVANRNLPTLVPLPDPVIQLSSGLYHTCAVTQRQDIYCWGDNSYGELGDGTYYNAVKPVKVKLP
jgi:alpha-tubulin suppressor-like RCC1 family protein